MAVERISGVNCTDLQATGMALNDAIRRFQEAFDAESKEAILKRLRDRIASEKFLAPPQ